LENYNVMDLIKNKYLSNHKENALKHVEEVADTAVWLAKRYNLDIEKVRLAALLHDISAIMTPQEMYELAIVHGLDLLYKEELINKETYYAARATLRSEYEKDQRICTQPRQNLLGNRCVCL